MLMYQQKDSRLLNSGHSSIVFTRVEILDQPGLKSLGFLIATLKFRPTQDLFLGSSDSASWELLLKTFCEHGNISFLKLYPIKLL